MNVICLMGRLTAEPELKQTQTGVSVTSFQIAVDRAYQPKDKERQADFIPVTAWRQTAEFICRYFHKGQRIALSGSLQSRNYTDREGNKRTAYEVICDNAFFAESKSTANTGFGGGFPAPTSDSQVPAFTESKPSFSTAAKTDFEEIVGDDELPF